MTLPSALATYYEDLFIFNQQRVTATATLTHITILFYYLHGWIFVLADWYGFLEQHALRSGKHRLPTPAKQWAAIQEATFDTFVMKPLAFYLLYPVMAEFVNMDEVDPTTLCWRRVVSDWIIMEATYSILFYSVHRMLHSVKFLYVHVHKVHHSYYDTVGFAAQFHHPLESVFGIIYVLAGAVVIRPSFFTFCVFLATRFMEIIGNHMYSHVLLSLMRTAHPCTYVLLLFVPFDIADAHCGYEVPWRVMYPWSDVYPWGSGCRLHDYHHSHNIGTKTID
jgi:sterol desaturase/sphingolipid hydroxylase (fatty acid hydroxylase superfamily)